MFVPWQMFYFGFFASFFTHKNTKQKHIFAQFFGCMCWPLEQAILTYMSNTNVLELEGGGNETEARTDVRASHISGSGVSLKAVSLIIHIDYFWDKCWLMLIKNIKAVVLNMAPG